MGRDFIERTPQKHTCYIRNPFLLFTFLALAILIYYLEYCYFTQWNVACSSICAYVDMHSRAWTFTKTRGPSSFASSADTTPPWGPLHRSPFSPVYSPLWRPCSMGRSAMIFSLVTPPYPERTTRKRVLTPWSCSERDFFTRRNLISACHLSRFLIKYKLFSDHVNLIF